MLNCNVRDPGQAKMSAAQLHSFYLSFNQMTSAETQEIDSIFKCTVSESDYAVMHRFNISISLRDFQRLNDGSWLNDEIVNFYMQLLSEDCSRYGDFYFANTFFYTRLRDSKGSFCYDNVKAWMKDTNIFEMKKLLFPMHINGNHWALSVVDIEFKKILYIDSLPKDSTFLDVEVLNMWLSCEYNKHHDSPFELFQKINYSCPRQTNGLDCGVFMLTFAHLIYLGTDLNIMHQQVVPFMRRKIALSILRGKLQVLLSRDILVLFNVFKRMVQQIFVKVKSLIKKIFQQTVIKEVCLRGNFSTTGQRCRQQR